MRFAPMLPGDANHSRGCPARFRGGECKPWCPAHPLPEKEKALPLSLTVHSKALAEYLARWVHPPGSCQRCGRVLLDRAPGAKFCYEHLAKVRKPDGREYFQSMVPDEKRK